MRCTKRGALRAVVGGGVQVFRRDIHGACARQRLACQLVGCVGVPLQEVQACALGARDGGHV